MGVSVRILDKIGQTPFREFYMGRRVSDKNLDSRDARSKLKARGKPYWRLIGKGLHIGYRKGKRGGVWVVRRYLGGQSYQVETIAQADDVLGADGDRVLDFWQAQAAAREMSPRRPNGGSYTVRRAIADYLTHLDTRPAAKDVRYRLAAYAAPLLDRPVDELTADELRTWHREMAKTPARMRTARGAKQNYRPMDDDESVRKRQVSANAILAKLKSCLNFAYSEDNVKDAGAWKKVKPYKGVAVPRATYLTLAECKRLINAAEGDFRVLVRAALETGARISELWRLCVRDFNPDAGTLHIRKAKTKTDRHIILTEQGSAFFAQLAMGKSGSDLLLGREWKHTQHDKLMRAACKHAKIDPPIVFHGLRHTWASLAVMNGVPLMVVARNLGHVDTRQVERTYGHLAPGYVAEAIRAGAPRYDVVEPSNVKAL
jgi:integrase